MTSTQKSEFHARRNKQKPVKG